MASESQKEKEDARVCVHSYVADSDRMMQVGEGKAMHKIRITLAYWSRDTVS